MKTAVIGISIVLVAACVAVLLFGRGSSLSSHHASLSVLLKPHGINGDEAMNQRKNHTEQFLPDLFAVLKEAELTTVTDPNAPFNTISRGNGESDKTLTFKGQATGKDNTIPLEALVVIDTIEYETIRITLSEGYSVGPSDRLTKLYTKLDQALESLNGQKQSSLW
jgi:hypothetical protein